MSTLALLIAIAALALSICTYVRAARVSKPAPPVSAGVEERLTTLERAEQRRAQRDAEGARR